MLIVLLLLPLDNGMIKSGSYLKCLNCNKECYIPKNRINKFKYCSRSCGALYVRTLIKKNCKICNKEFEHISSRSNTAKYCSRTCYYKGQKLNGTITLLCMHCKKEFNGSPSHIGKRKFCSRDCQNKESHKIFKPAFSTVRKSMLRRGLINKCNRCSYDKQTKILGIHHKDRDRNNNELSNLEVLCPNCHSLEHLKHVCHGFTE